MSEEEQKLYADNFAEAAQPMVDFLHAYGDQYCTVIITQTSAELTHGALGLQFALKD